MADSQIAVYKQRVADVISSQTADNSIPPVAVGNKLGDLADILAERTRQFNPDTEVVIDENAAKVIVVQDDWAYWISINDLLQFSDEAIQAILISLNQEITNRTQADIDILLALNLETTNRIAGDLANTTGYIPSPSVDFSNSKKTNANIVFNAYDKTSGVPFFGKYFDTLPEGFAVNDAVWYNSPDHLGDGFIRKNYEFSVHSDWFSLVGDGVTNNQDKWEEAMSYMRAMGGGRFLVSSGSYVIDGFSVPARTTIEGTSIGVAELKLKPNSTVDIFIDTPTAYNGSIENLYINGDRANQTKADIHGIRLNADGGNSNYMFLVRRNYIRNFTGDGIHAVSPSFIFSVQSNRIRDCKGYGIYNSSTDNGFFDNTCAVCDKGGMYNIGNNTRVIGGKFLFNGHPDYPESGGIIESSARSQYVGVECQENYYHGFVLDNARYSTFTSCVADMNNVARRPISLGGLNNVGDPNAVGYGLKVVASVYNSVEMMITTAAPSSSLKYTQFGKSIDSQSFNNIFRIIQEPQYGADNVVAPTKNKYLEFEGSVLITTDADQVIPAGTTRVVITGALTANRLLTLEAPTFVDKITFVDRRSTTNSAFHFDLNVAFGLNTSSTRTSLLPNCITVIEQFNIGATGQWRLVSEWKGSAYNSAEVDALITGANTFATNTIKSGNVISKTGAYTILAGDFGKNTILTVLIDASAGDLVLLLGSAPASLGYIINVIRLDNSNNVVSIAGRTVATVREPINGDSINPYYLLKDRPASFVSNSIGWFTINPLKVNKKIYNASTTDIVNKAFLNSTFPVNVFPPQETTVCYYNLGMEYERVEPTVWIERNVQITV